MGSEVKTLLLILVISIHFNSQEAACCARGDNTGTQSEMGNSELNSAGNNPNDGGTIPDYIFSFEPFVA
ncbi:unnamed protein product [Schistosoma bovis]|nr:unnamed protein product [Schistosoma bovis]CAH8550101.1 unnamed protein product [Schistosoma bovis]